MQVSAEIQAVQRQCRDHRGLGLDSENLEDAREQVGVHGRQERGQSSVGERAAEAVAGGDGARDSAEGPMLQNEGIHPIGVEKGDDGEADEEGHQHH